MNKQASNGTARQQGGITLLSGLIMLAAISLLALVASASMLLQIRMSKNFAHSLQAQHFADYAVSQGEQFIFSLEHDSRMPDCDRPCFSSPLDVLLNENVELPLFPELEENSWWQANALPADRNPFSGLILEGSWNQDGPAPRFLIKELHFDARNGSTDSPGALAIVGIGYYRILGRGVGEGPAAVAISESIIARPWKDLAAVEFESGSEARFCAEFEPWYHCGRLSWRQRR